MKEMIDELQGVYGTTWILLCFFAAAVYLFFAEKDKRKSIVYPSLIMAFFIFNPFLYKAVYSRILDYAYWRLTWALPVIPVLACAFVSIVSKCRKKITKFAAVFALAAVVILAGSPVYANPLTTFTKAENAYKLPQAAIDVCDYLEAQDDFTGAVVSERLYCYTRQYSTRFVQLYGRNANGYITYIPKEFKAVYDELQKGEEADLNLVSQQMRGWLPCRYLVLSDAYDNISEQKLTEAGFTKVNDIDGYSIYRLN